MKVNRKVRETQTNNAGHMIKETFADLKHALEDALAFEGGMRHELKLTRIEGSRTLNESAKIEGSDKTSRGGFVNLIWPTSMV